MEAQVLEAPLSQSDLIQELVDHRMSDRFAIFYVTITDIDRDGVFVDGPFFGGEIESHEEAELLATEITNDKSLPGTICTKLFRFKPNQLCSDISRLAHKYFTKFRNDIYEQEETQNRKRRRL